MSATLYLPLDLVIAAGGEDELKPHPDNSDNPNEVFISHRGIEIFAQVWRGEHSVYEFIAVLDAAMKKHQEEGQQS